MALPVVYRGGGEQSIASYDYVDLADGIGYVTLYGSVTQISSAGLLTKSTIYSDLITRQGTITGTAGAKCFDIDFDNVINKPLVIRGKAYINIPMVGYQQAADGDTFVWPECYLRKWDGTTETNIATASGAMIRHNFTSPTHTYYHPRMSLVVLDVPLTRFKKGETLRLTVEAWGCENTTGTSIMNIGHDPKNRTDSASNFQSTDNTQLMFFLPTVIDL